MLRALVAALLVANVLFWTWSEGWLDGLTGVPAGGIREPERLARQRQPEVMNILPANGTTTANAGDAASAAAAATAAAPDCLESGPLTAEVAGKAQAALTAALPELAGRLVAVQRDVPGAWILYMGRFADDEAVARKEEELSRFRTLEIQRLPAGSDLAPGLSLGTHPSRAAATRALQQLEQRGIRTARLVTLQAPRVEHRVRLEPAGDSWLQRLSAVGTPAGDTLRFEACAPPPAAISSAPPASAP